MEIKGNYLIIRWHIDDIINYAEENHSLKLTKSEAKNILKEIAQNNDCNMGVNWDVIDYYIDRFKEYNEID